MEVPGYHKYRELERSQPLWKRIWAMRIPPKMRVFVWRGCRDVLPTTMILRSKGIEIPRSCYLCNWEEETSQHLLTDCPYMTQALHAAAGVMSYPMIEGGETWNEALLNLVSSRDKEVLERCFVTWYEIWAECNKARKNYQIRTPHQVGWVAASNIAAYYAANEKSQHEGGMEPMATKWQKPAANFAKVNVDFAGFSTENTHDLGMIIRDENGHFLEARAQRGDV